MLRNLNKRDYPLDVACEVCGNKNIRLVYHHWNDETPNRGIWMCNSCHHIVEFSEDERLENVLTKYHKLKNQICMEVLC